MPKNEKIIEGDILLFTLEKSKFVLGKVLFTSKRFKNVILLGIYGEIVDVKKIPDDMAESYSDTIYTSLKGIIDYGWERIGNVPVTASDKALTERNVGGHIYIEDTFIRNEKEADKDIPLMSVYGFLALERKIKKMFGVEINF